MLTDYMSYTLDSTTYQMMHISRFQMLAWSLYDGMYERVGIIYFIYYIYNYETSCQNLYNLLNR